MTETTPKKEKTTIRALQGSQDNEAQLATYCDSAGTFPRTGSLSLQVREFTMLFQKPVVSSFSARFIAGYQGQVRRATMPMTLVCSKDCKHLFQSVANLGNAANEKDR